MRTTVEFDDDTAAGVEQLRRVAGLGTSEAVNELIRRGLAADRPRPVFRQATRRLNVKMDVSNVANALEAIERPAARY